MNVKSAVVHGASPAPGKVDLASDGLVTKHVLMVEPSLTMGKGFTTVGELGLPDPDLAKAQHDAYVQALRQQGVKVDVFPATKEPDQHFVEDMASVFRTAGGEMVVVVAKPATKERAKETGYVLEILENYFPKSSFMHLPSGSATIEFGDVVRFGGHVLIGQSKRTNAAGAAALQETLAAINPVYTVQAIPVEGGLHADTCMSPLDGMTLLHDPAMPLPKGFRFVVVTLPESENYAASVLAINQSTVIMPTDMNHMVHEYPFTAAVLGKYFEQVIKTPMSEFHKMDGSLRCLKLAIHWDDMPLHE